MVSALIALSGDSDAAARTLKLSQRQRGDIDDNAALRTAPTMAAMDRYTGVLYDALGAASLARAARNWLGAHVLIQSAPFGLVGGGDLIPTYRLAAATSLPGIPPLRRVWAGATTAALRELAPPFVLDLRSESYAALGPLPDDVPSAYVRVVTRTGDEGAPVRALNHFNKHAKGDLVRMLATERPQISSLGAFRRWAARNGLSVRDGAPGAHGARELQLVTTP